MSEGEQLEIEIKLRVADAAALQRKLARLGAKRVRRVHERNVLYDTPAGDLRRAGKLLRLRWNNGAAVMTLKAPAARQGASRARFKVRRELEFAVDARKAQAALRAAGFVSGFRYEKRRTSYRVAGAGRVKVELDETPIGCFVELEGVPRAIERMAQRLGYGRGDYITANYLTLFLQHCRKERSRRKHMLFAKSKGALDRRG